MKQLTKVLLADDDPVLRKLLPLQLSAEDFEISTVADGQEVLNALREEDFDVILLDVNLPEISGLEILATIRQTEDSPEIIMLTADLSLQTGVEAMRRGAFDYITKPAAPELIEAIIRKALEKHSLVKQNQLLKAVVRSQSGISITEPVHQSSEMRKIFAQAKIVAKTDTTLLIMGESGTGKDVLARWIHAHSKRAELPFISINCGALPENLFESEFFGHEKGSFTGATTQKVGLIESAEGSTLFLDEIGEMPLLMQVKLLHFLENGSFRRVGATRDRKADVRVIAATNRPLEEDVKNKNFRADLYYRLNVISFHIPALRKRKEDIPELIETFLSDLRIRFNRPRLTFSNFAIETLLNHNWYGNIRELRNTIERAIVLSPNDFIEEIYELNDALKHDSIAPNQTTFELLPLAEIERRHILRVLAEVGGKREKAATILGITSRTLYRKLKELNLDK
ncbi:MAG TPA: sigma-54 dependent transcriptional regulator [Pyrinomonadaceae bacterium]|nr:sigma-54 dependent transcriptional regulator [Pyrinomonadaceae bacterium]